MKRQIDHVNQNITLAVPKTLLRKFKRLAVDREKSVSAFVRELMEDALRSTDSYEQARKQALEDLKRPLDLGTHGKITWTRDELHERR